MKAREKLSPGCPWLCPCETVKPALGDHTDFQKKCRKDHHKKNGQSRKRPAVLDKHRIILCRQIAVPHPFQRIVNQIRAPWSTAANNAARYKSSKQSKLIKFVRSFSESENILSSCFLSFQLFMLPIIAHLRSPNIIYY